MSIKKVYEELVQLLESNKDVKVKTILDKVYLLCESKKSTTTHLCDKEGNVIAIFCYYHKQWELLSEVEYGSKANSTTGFNTMCKIGTSKWTKAQRDAEKAKSQMLSDVANGKVDPSTILKLSEDIEASRKLMDTTDMPIGHTLEEVEALV
jgi:hypothetical protein